MIAEQQTTDSLRQNPLVRHLAAVIFIKIMLLVVLWWAFFRAPASDSQHFIDVQTHIAGYPEGSATLLEE